MRQRRWPRRFSRQWQQERALQADADADETARRVYLLGWVMSRFSSFAGPMFRPRTGDGTDTVSPYRGFRSGRSRWRPDDTGYGEPVEPPARHGSSTQEHRWLAGAEGEPMSDGVIGDDEWYGDPASR